MLDFLKELTRRKVWLFGGIYLALGWIVLQVVIAVEATMELPNWIDQSVLVLLVVGFPFALLLAWAQESGSVVALGGDHEPLPETKAPSTEYPGFSVAVLPFNNLSDERELSWVADGLAEDLITRLSMAPIAMVTARNSSFAYKGEAPDIRDVGEALGVRFVVEGSIRLIDETLRVTAQLVDASTGGHIWSESYDHPRARLGGMQDEVVDRISGEVIVTMWEVGISRLNALPQDAFEAQDFFHLASKGLGASTLEGVISSIELIEEGLRRFPDVAWLHSELAHFCTARVFFEPKRREELFAKSEYHLHHALHMAPNSAQTLFRCAWVRFMQGRLDEALAHAEKFKTLYPNARSVTTVLADTYRAHGRYEEAMIEIDGWMVQAGTRHIDRSYMLGVKGDTLLGLGDFAAAEATLREAAIISRARNSQCSLIVALSHQGKLAEARAELDRFETLFGKGTLERIARRLSRFSKDEAWCDTYVEGLRLAGME